MSQGADPAGEMWDVIVVGSGPAGSATALTLARLGRRALLVEKRRSTGVKLGETLPPASIDLIAHFLGPETGTAGRPFDAFPTTGNVSSWASEGADAADFFFASSGHGLCVDRPAFDDALRDAAAAAGATLLKGASFQSCERVLDGSLNWRVTLATDAGARQDRARYLVDCSGRRRGPGALGASIEDDDDRLFAYARWFSCPGGDDDRRTRIEAAPEGWWYSSRLPGAVGRNGAAGRLLHGPRPAGRAARRVAGRFRRALGTLGDDRARAQGSRLSTLRGDPRRAGRRPAAAGVLRRRLDGGRRRGAGL
ncbi:NAD(P)/FAD-dependent oxidoreductase [Chenggangzhangella methanolivorans]|uniref:NAD(P)/FAD-dependent oxidoreductase n=1 Tax=Chenggangzhangella methanolivorans TaxID=1437009 RepID=UPI0021BDCF6E|nr:FAD-dependent oxidoreductase [Chenggangzhangella methanolivorans]